MALLLRSAQSSKHKYKPLSMSFRRIPGTLFRPARGYPPVYYLPRNDADMSLLVRTTHYTYCPYKGDCTYYSIPIGGSKSEYAVWTYEKPYEAVASIKEYLAFYPSRVDAIEVIS